jgi:hypothetical protein
MKQIKLSMDLLKEGCTNFPKKPGNHFKILSPRGATESNFHTEDPQIFGATVKTCVATATLQYGFVHPCVKGMPSATRYINA